jgi:hypothetical protein
MRKDPSLITLHYRSAAASDSTATDSSSTGGSSGVTETRKHAYRLETVEKKEEFIRVVQDSLKRFS